MNKIIHYCWFGGKPMPKKLTKYLETWSRYFPDYEIRRWDETNFDVRRCQYVSQAYDAKKWAFVSDYVRFFVLEKYGGIYFDTDVEVIRPFNELMDLEAFAAFETDEFIAPGLGLYAKYPGNEIITKTKRWYETHPFLDQNGDRIRINVCSVFTNVLLQFGFVPNGHYQICNGMTLFPKDYFCPFDDATGILYKTENTYAIHWYDKSWMSKRKIIRNRCTRLLHRVFGKDIRRKVEKLIGK